MIDNNSTFKEYAKLRENVSTNAIVKLKKTLIYLEFRMFHNRVLELLIKLLQSGNN